MVHNLLKAWFDIVADWGYAGVFFLMALESSIVPIPSEVVMPPAAFWASQGKMGFWGVILSGTAGSYFGSVVSYFMARWLGTPVIRRYGKYFLLSPEKIYFAEQWVKAYGAFGVFISRLLPVVRHLISIPAGIFRMNFLRFSIATIVGAFLWCTILSWFGAKVIGDSPELLQSPEALVAVCKAKLHWFIAGTLVLAAAYALVVRAKSKLAIQKN